MAIIEKNNILYWTIQRGVTESITIIKADGWVYDEILMEFKQSNNIDDFAVKTLEIGDGLTVNGNDLVISLTYPQTTVLNTNKLYVDIKLRTGSTVIAPIPFIIILNETITKIV